MQAEIIAIGDEILSGQTQDTNSAFIANHLNLNGIAVKQTRVIADDHQSVINALDSLLPGTGLVFITGGLGPTRDDITKQTLCDYFGGELEFNEEVYQNILDLFSQSEMEPLESHKEQAWLPSSCRVIINKIGTASGMHFQKNDVNYFCCPGVPYEAEHLVADSIIPWIKENLQGGKVVHKNVLTIGIGESKLASKIKDWEDQLPGWLKLAYLPSLGTVKLRLSSYEKDPEEARQVMAQKVKILQELIGDYIFGEEDQTIEGTLGKLLEVGNMSLSTAESCTGGYLAGMITSIPGSSSYYKGTVVSYTNEVKAEVLGVKPESLEKHGAVSQVVAEEMAVCAREKFQTTYALSTTGIAGPAGGSISKPVGTVWIALAGPEGVKSRVFHFGKDRKQNIKRSALMALDMLRRELQKKKS